MKTILEEMREIEDQAKELKKMLTGFHNPTFRYENDEGEDVREIQEKAEARMDAAREAEYERNADHAKDNEI